MIYGYARVSTAEQNLDRQLEAFKEFGVDKVFSDKISGKNFERDNYIKMLDELKAGDLLVIKSIDRLGRNYEMIIDEWRKITHDIQADIVVIDMPLLDTRDKEKGLTGKFISDIVLQILSYVAETERNNIKKRQAEGIRIAKEKGVHMGRPKYQLPDNFNEVFNQYDKMEITLEQALDTLNMSSSTFYKCAREMGLKITRKPNKKCKITSEEFTKVYNDYNSGKISINDAIQLLNISVRTFYRYAMRMGFVKTRTKKCNITSEEFIKVYNGYNTNKISIKDALKLLNICGTTFYKYAKKIGIYNKKKPKPNRLPKKPKPRKLAKKHKVCKVQKKPKISKLPKKPKIYKKYILESEFITKEFTNKKDICNELKICSQTLQKYLKGGYTIINRLGITIEEIKE